MKKIFFATIISVITFLAAQINICSAMIAPYQMYLGGLTYGSKIDEMKKIYGEPDAIYNGVENYASCSYGDGVIVSYNKISGQIIGIIVTEKNGWKIDGDIGVGNNIEEWLANHSEAEKIKVGDVQTVYLYFHYKSNPVAHETFRNYGLFIAFNTESGKITQLRIAGDNDMATFEEIYEDIMSDMLIPIEK